MPNTVRLQRVLRAPPERIYRAFTDAAALCKWLPPHGFSGSIDRMEAAVGGGYHMAFTNFSGGGSHAFSTTFTEMQPGQKLVYTSRFDAGLPGEMQTTVLFKPVACGTELEVTQAGIPDAIPTEFCYLGWQESLTLLAQLVEPEIPAGY